MNPYQRRRDSSVGNVKALCVLLVLCLFGGSLIVQNRLAGEEAVHSTELAAETKHLQETLAKNAARLEQIESGAQSLQGSLGELSRQLAAHRAQFGAAGGVPAAAGADAGDSTAALVHAANARLQAVHSELSKVVASKTEQLETHRQGLVDRHQKRRAAAKQAAEAEAAKRLAAEEKTRALETHRQELVDRHQKRRAAAKRHAEFEARKRLAAEGSGVDGVSNMDKWGQCAPPTKARWASSGASTRARYSRSRSHAAVGSSRRSAR